MHVYGSNQVHGPHSVKGPHPTRGATPASGPSRPASPSDQLDISPAASAAAEAADGDIRADLVARVRSEIAAGSYETPDKVAGAVDRLLDEIG